MIILFDPTKMFDINLWRLLDFGKHTDVSVEVWLDEQGISWEEKALVEFMSGNFLAFPKLKKLSFRIRGALQQDIDLTLLNRFVTLFVKVLSNDMLLIVEILGFSYGRRVNEAVQRVKILFSQIER